MTAASESGANDSNAWDYKHLWSALVVAFVLQMMLLPCLCDVGMAKTKLALWFDLLVAVRIGSARVLGESGRGWVFYAILIWTSPAWIEGLVFVVRGPH